MPAAVSAVLPAPAPVPAGAVAALDLPELVELVQEIAADPGAWLPEVEHHDDRRWWTRLVGTDAVDVWLITWPGGGATDLHDHGASSAAFTVVEGELEEVRPVGEGGLSSTDLAPGRVQWVSPGIVHDVRNTAGGRATSIHAYSPPLEQMTYYRPGASGLEVVRTIRGDQPETDQEW